MLFPAPEAIKGCSGIGTWGIGAGRWVVSGEEVCLDALNPDNHGSGMVPERRMPLVPVTRAPNSSSRLIKTKRLAAIRLLALAGE
jgi:hypothetical protein